MARELSDLLCEAPINFRAFLLFERRAKTEGNDRSKTIKGGCVSIDGRITMASEECAERCTENGAFILFDFIRAGGAFGRFLMFAQKEARRSVPVPGDDRTERRVQLKRPGECFCSV